MSNSDIIIHVLNGLGREYNNFVISAHNREVTLTFGEIKARLINHQQWMKDQDSKMSSLFDTQNSVMYNKNTQYGGHNKKNGKMKGTFKNNTFVQGSNSSGGSSGGFNGTGTSPGNGFSSGGSRNGNEISGDANTIDWSTVECQIFIRRGHSASRCYYRYTPYRNSISSVQRAFAGIELYAGSEDNAASLPTAAQWIPDSGATNHITSDASILTDSTPYNGSANVMIGNGSR